MLNLLLKKKKTLMKLNILCQIALLFFAIDTWAGDYVFQPTKGIEQFWQTTDRVGITTANTSYGSMEQLSFWVSSKTGSSRNENILFATGYQLKTGTTYYAYYPYIWAEDFNANNIYCDYKSQIQSNNGKVSHIASADYQMASATPSATDCAFYFQHIGGVMKVTFPAPEAMTIASMSIKAQSPVVATAASMNIVGKTVELTDYATSLTLQTQGISVSKGEEVVLYLATPAQDLSAYPLDITVTDSNGKKSTIARVMGPNIKAGYLYDISLNDKPQASKSIAPYDIAGAKAAVKATGIANPLAVTSDILLDNSYTVQYATQGKKGDVNGDGDVDVLDVVALTGYYVKGRTAELSADICDMNDDGDIDVLDVIEIISLYTKSK